MIKGNCVSFSPHQIDLMRKAGQLTAKARAFAGTLIQPGITTRDIDQQVRDLSKVVGYGINWALQDLEIEEMNALLS